MRDLIEVMQNANYDPAFVSKIPCAREHTVLRGVAAGTAEFASVKVGQTKVVLVLLPWEMRDRVWCV